MKKYLSLLLAVIMLVTSVGFNMFAFAADDSCTHTNNIDTNNPKYYKVVNPTCDEEGYTIYYCIFCKDKNIEVEVTRGNYTADLGHTLDKGHFEPTESGNYRKYFECTRTYQNGEKCNFRVNEQHDNGDEVVYYLVTFMNNRVPEAYTTDANGVKLISGYKAEAELLKSYYVKAGDGITYDGDNFLLGKTVAFGEHQRLGWTTSDKQEIKLASEYTAAEIESFKNATKEIKANTVFYPVFAGVDTYYDVVFNSLNGQITNPQRVKHGGFPSYRVNGKPTNDYYPNPEKPEDIVNYYDFAGWSTSRNSTAGIPTEEIETTPIHARTNYYPIFTPVAKNYTVEFYKYDQSLIKAFDGVHLNTNLLANPEISSLNNDELLKKPSTATFTYEWTGKWRILTPDGKLGDVVDLQNFRVTVDDYFVYVDENGNTLPLGNKYGELKKIIRLVPDYYDRLIVYNVGVLMTIPAGEDQYYYLGDAAVRVFDYNNQLVASGKTDAQGKFRCQLNYRENMPYTVKITTVDSKYIGESKITKEFEKDENGNAEREAMTLNVCNVNMTRNPEYETHCSCIHHNSLLQPIWVRILNILYTFFNVRYECCYDMYSTIGPLLDYTKEG